VNRVFFLDSVSGWTVEDGGRTRYTANGGLDWSYGPVPLHISSDLRGVFFKTAQIGWSVGDGGIVLKSLDGGVNWMDWNSGGRIYDSNDPTELAQLYSILESEVAREGRVRADSMLHAFLCAGEGVRAGSAIPQ
jgi:photosystem II stability/assembly factor-like uncharacterized protein